MSDSVFTSTNVVQLTASLQSIHSFSSQIHGISENLGGNADAAFNTALTLQAKVQDMSKSVETARRETQGLREESRKITEILKLLHGIVEATHVLGINASIVAARAGTTGKAFQVLSKEIRKLADSSAQSLRQIESIVYGLQTKIDLVSSRIDDTRSLAMDQTESLLAVAGNLQGTVLSVNVIHTISGTACSEASTLIGTVEKIGLAAGAL